MKRYSCVEDVAVDVDDTGEHLQMLLEDAAKHLDKLRCFKGGILEDVKAFGYLVSHHEMMQYYVKQLKTLVCDCRRSEGFSEAPAAGGRMQELNEDAVQ